MQRYALSVEGAERMLSALVRDRRIIRVDVRGEPRWASV